MTPDMDAVGHGKMDWFFDEYVYGTALPSYQFNASFGKGSTGDVTLSYVLTQSQVDASFVMLVPIYVELSDGRVAFVGRVIRRGDSTVQGKVSLTGLTNVPKMALVNYHDDVLASN